MSFIRILTVACLFSAPFQICFAAEKKTEFENKKYDLGEIVVSLTANYYAEMYYDNENTLKQNGSFVLNSSVSRKFFELLTVYINAENILNNEFVILKSLSSSDTTAPGIIVSAGCKLSF